MRLLIELIKGLQVRKSKLRSTLITENCLSYHTVQTLVVKSKTCVEQPLKNRQTLDLNDKWKLNEGGAFCNTFYLHFAIIGIENQFSFFLRVTVLHSFTVCSLIDLI